MAYKNMEKSVSRENPPYLTSTFRKLVLVVLNIYNTIHNFNKKKSGTITGKAAILESQIQMNIIMGPCGRNPKSDSVSIFIKMIYLIYNVSYLQNYPIFESQMY